MSSASAQPAGNPPAEPDFAAILQKPEHGFTQLLLLIMPAGFIPRPQTDQHNFEILLENHNTMTAAHKAEILEEQKQARAMALAPATVISGVVSLVIAGSLALAAIVSGAQLLILALLLLVGAGALFLCRWYLFEGIKTLCQEHAKKVWRVRGRVVFGEISLDLRAKGLAVELLSLYGTWQRLEKRLRDLGKVDKTGDLRQLKLDDFPQDYDGLLLRNQYAALGLGILFLIGGLVSLGFFIFHR